MTEAEWLTFTTLDDRFQVLPDRVVQNERKCRLFAVACSRRIWRYIPDEVSKQVVEALESLADGAITWDEWESYCEAYSGSEGACAANEAPDDPPSVEGWARSVIVTCMFDGWLRLVRDTAAYCRATVEADPPKRTARKRKQEEDRAHCDLLRDIFGNPFRAVTFAPEWRTGTAVALARQMYESRDFGAMPILADAFQDAGCDHEDILMHCRDQKATHVRGCWVVDLLLGKE
jgi:hypothetical protein